MKSPPRPQHEAPATAKPARLRLYNTLTRRKESLAPIDPEAVRLYVCGPTVYDFAHIGNARPVIVFDVLFRLLRHIYGANHVIYVRNITDVEDKINARAERDYPDLPLNEAIARVTEATERQFHEDVSALGALAPTHEPRATQYIDTMRAMIERLIARGVAYVAEDHVLFSPSAMDALGSAPRYGTLAHRSLDEMLAGARVDVAPYKRDPMDFVLWKPSKPNEPGWPSPAGIAAPGRPGWHIECSAMSMATLLEPFGGGLQCDDPNRNIFDIHGGGIDLVFPHHENEIAQSCSAFHSSRMANVWMHNGFLQVEGEKMAKSAGNFVTIRELLRGWKGEPWSGAAIRLAMLETHYRQPIDWTLDGLTRAKAEVQMVALDTGYGSPEQNDFGSRDAYEHAWLSDADPSAQVLEALSDDLNTPAALTHLRGAISQSSTISDDKRVKLVHDMRFLGIFRDEKQRAWLTGPPRPSHTPRSLLVEVIAKGRAYKIGRANNDLEFVTETQGWLEDKQFTVAPDGTIAYQPRRLLRGVTEETIEELIRRRQDARNRKDWKEADRIRDELAALGVAIKDNKDGATTWELKR
jgi:cysteinyl-tRNA synthetase